MIRPLATRLASLLLVAWAGFACATPGPPVPVETGQLFFWKVDGDGAGAAHLLGSIHAAREAFEFDPAIKRAYDDADALVLELAPDQMEPDVMIASLKARAPLPAGVQLRDVISPELYGRLSDALAERGASTFQIDNMEPWFAFLQLLQLSLQDAGLETENGIDHRLAARATDPDDAKPTFGLETADSQIAIFDELPVETQELLLEQVLNEAEADDAVGVGSLIDAWRKGDTEAMEAYVLSELGKDAAADAFYEAIYFARNREMASRVAKLVDAGGDWFVVIGAGHLVGTQGVPALLSQQGFRLEQLPKTAPPQTGFAE